MNNNNLYQDFIYLYHQGTEFQAFRHLGAHLLPINDPSAVSFKVYAPNAKSVSVVGDFNQWDTQSHTMTYDQSGIWSIIIENIHEGDLYKYAITSQADQTVLKQDPYGYYSQLRPDTASIIKNPFNYRWTDGLWMKKRETTNHFTSPMNIYEVSLSSWAEIIENNQPINIKKVGKKLIDYCKKMHYTHIEVLPITEYPLDTSWGYQVTGYFSLSGRLSSIKDMQSFINLCHKNNIGVILDWVPGHFCPDEHGLLSFDGTPLYGGDLHPNWGTYKFNFGNKHVWSFLLSSAYYFASVFHIDGIRVDGVSSIIDYNFGKNEENIFVEDKNATAFLKNFNKTMHDEYKGFITIAEDSSDYVGVTCKDELGLGFDYKWNMGWMNDTLFYYEKDFPSRGKYHQKLTFSSVYSHKEKFMLPFSHDEVVHGKKHMIDKMPGEYTDKFSDLKTLLAYQMFHPGKKLLFMGIEIAQFMEWRYYEPIEWFMLKYPIHKGFQAYVKMLNQFYLDHEELYDQDYSPYGFEWIDANNSHDNVFVFLRRSKMGNNIVIIINNSPFEYRDFKVGVPEFGTYSEIFTSNLLVHGGTDIHNTADIVALKKPWQEREYQVTIVVPPLSATVIKKNTGEINV